MAREPAGASTEDFLDLVSEAGRIRGTEDARMATEAVLATLAEHLDPGEARDLAAELPPEVAAFVATTTPAERFDVDELVERVARREGVDPDTAEIHVRAVFHALGLAVSDKAIRDVAAELPKDFAPLLPKGPHVEVLSSGAFFQRVADRAATDLDGARRLTDAVLETLGERIAGGEVDDLIARLPRALHEPLRRGKEHSGGKATRMSLDDFLDRVAQRAGITDRMAARDAASAVMRTLREAVGDEEFFDVTSELPEADVSALVR